MGLTASSLISTFGSDGSVVAEAAGWLALVAPPYRAIAERAGMVVLTLPPETVTVWEQSWVENTLQYSPSGSVVS